VNFSLHFFNNCCRY